MWAQDVHWSQFNDNPVFQNPGNAGNFNGDYRITANYRSQWKSVTVPFSTLSFAGDMCLPKHRNIGLGALFFHDQVGDGKFRTVELQFNASALLKLTSDSMHTLRPGINFGINHRQVNIGNLSFDNQYDGFQYNALLPSYELYQNDRFTNVSIGLGAVYSYFRNARENFNVGIGLFNLNRPNQDFTEPPFRETFV